MTKSLHRVQTIHYLLIAAFFGLITTIFTYNAYAGGNYIELTPILTRALDPTYLQNDFFTNVAAGSLSRLYYAKLVTFIAQSEQNLPATALILTAISNMAIATITFGLARDLFLKSNTAGILASALTMSVTAFALGWRSAVYFDSLIPATLAIPLVLAAIWSAAREKPLLAVVICGITTLIHPLIGLEAGAVILITSILHYLLKYHNLSVPFWKKFSLPAFLFALILIFILVPQLKEPTIDTHTFVTILAYFRTPHHRLPSTFSIPDYISAASFLSAAILLYFRQWKISDQTINLFNGLFAIIILILTLGGYIFVELIPIRIWTTAQTFRLLYLLRWLGLIFVAGLLASIKEESSRKSMFLVGVLNPVALGGVTWTDTIKEWLQKRQNRLGQLLDPLPILLIAVAVLVYLSLNILSALLLAAFLFIILFFNLFPQKRFVIPLLSLITITLILAGWYRQLPNMGQATSITRAIDLPANEPSELGPDGDETAIFARENTPQDTIFLTPPNFGHFRILARRAIVVDFKAFPFSDLAMLEWYERIMAIYGPSDKLGFQVMDELKQNYANLDDQSLLALQEKYHFSYAVLYQETPTNFEVLFQNGQFKMVEIK